MLEFNQPSRISTEPNFTFNYSLDENNLPGRGILLFFLLLPAPLPRFDLQPDCISNKLCNLIFIF